jgi:hypothetical protein
MDARALNDLRAKLRAEGYVGGTGQLRALIDEAEFSTAKRLVLSRWKANGSGKQYQALVAAFAHAQKRGLSILIFNNPDTATLVLSQEQGSRGVRLGWLGVSMRELSWRYYRGNENVGERNQST